MGQFEMKFLANRHLAVPEDSSVIGERPLSGSGKLLFSPRTCARSLNLEEKEVKKGIIYKHAIVVDIVYNINSVDNTNYPIIVELGWLDLNQLELRVISPYKDPVNSTSRVMFRFP